MLFQNTEFMERKKKKLIDLFMEVYNPIYEEDDKKYISQLIVNMMHRKPRLDIHSKYLTVPYRYENLIRTRQFEIFKTILDKQIIKERNHLNYQRQCLWKISETKNCIYKSSIIGVRKKNNL